MWHRWASSAGPPASTGAGAEGSSGRTWHHCIKIGKRWKKTEGDVMKVDGDGWRAFQKSWAFPHRSPFWSKFIYKIVDFEHFSMLFIEGSRSIYDMRFQSWPATKWLLKFKNTPKESWTGSDEGFLWFPVFFAWRPHMSCVPMSWTISFLMLSFVFFHCLLCIHLSSYWKTALGLLCFHWAFPIKLSRLLCDLATFKRKESVDSSSTLWKDFPQGSIYNMRFPICFTTRGLFYPQVLHQRITGMAWARIGLSCDLPQHLQPPSTTSYRKSVETCGSQ